MKRLRSKSVDLTVQCISGLGKSFLCGSGMETPSPTAFYQNASEVMSYGLDESLTNENEENRHVGTIQRLCNSLKRPFQNSLNSSKRYLLRNLGDGSDQEKETCSLLPLLFEIIPLTPMKATAWLFNVGIKLRWSTLVTMVSGKVVVAEKLATSNLSMWKKTTFGCGGFQKVTQSFKTSARGPKVFLIYCRQ